MTGKNGLDLKKSTYCKMQNDRKTKVVIEQSGSGNVAVKNKVMGFQNDRKRAKDKIWAMQQVMGFQNDRKPAKDKICAMQQVMGFQNDRKPAKDKICAMQQVRLLLWVSPHSFWASVLVSWFLPVPPGSLCFVFFCECCSESEDSLNLS